MLVIVLKVFWLYLKLDPFVPCVVCGCLLPQVDGSWA